MVCETYETIWLVIGLFTLGGIGSGLAIGYGLGCLTAYRNRPRRARSGRRIYGRA